MQPPREKQPYHIPPARSRILSWLILACLAGFSLLELAAMLLYPGGTFWDRTTQGASFWQNFICDFNSPVALDGETNFFGSRFAQGAMLLMAIGLGPFWWIVPRLAPHHARLGIVIRALGCASLAGIAAAALMPSSRFGRLHGAAVILAAVPGLTAAGLAAIGLALAEKRPKVGAALASTFLAFALADFALYLRTMVRGGPGPILLPIAQKIALVLLMAWMIVVSRKASPSRSQPGL